MYHMCEILKLFKTNLNVATPGQYHQTLYRWKEIINTVCRFSSIRLKDMLEELMNTIDQFEEDWLNPEREIEPMQNILLLIDPLIRYIYVFSFLHFVFKLEVFNFNYIFSFREIEQIPCPKRE